jgi:hypothetical protein
VERTGHGEHGQENQGEMMMENDQGDKSYYRRYALILLSIDSLAALGVVSLCLLMGATELSHSDSVVSAIVVAIIVVLSIWCFFLLPVSSVFVAIGSLRRFRERKAKVFFFCSLLLLVFWVLFLLACVQ